MPPTHKPWWKADADTDHSDKLAKLPSDAARWAWFRMMCRAKTQRRMGVFSGRAHLRSVLGQHGRFVPELVRVGVAHEWPTDCYRCSQDYSADAQPGDVVVHDYRREQRDPTNATRQAAWRDRNAVSNTGGNAGRNADLTMDSRALSPSTTTSPSREAIDEPYQVAVPPEADELRALAEELTGIPSVLANVWGGLGEKAVRLARKHGIVAVEREWRRIAAEERGMPELRQLVLGADDALNPIPRAELSREEREAAEKADLLRRIELGQFTAALRPDHAS